MLGALDYSRMSRHLLVTAGDDGSIHLWDTTGRSPKVLISCIFHERLGHKCVFGQEIILCLDHQSLSNSAEISEISLIVVNLQSTRIFLRYIPFLLPKVEN